MSTPIKAVIIVGAGQAGARTAICLRDEGFVGRIMLVGAEPSLPYERPPLSKELLLDATYDEARCRVLDATAWQERKIEVLTSTRVDQIEAAAHRIRLHDGRCLAYDKLVVATGSSAQRVSIEGADEGSVHLLRTLEDAREMRRALSEARHIAVIGGGLIGLEVAAAARVRGMEVRVLEAAPSLLSRVAPVIVSDFVRHLHEQRGVTVRLGVCIERFERLSGKGWRLFNRCEGFDVDGVVAGIGARANIELAQAVGMACSESGIEVDEHGRTSVDDIYAVGDVAAFWSQRYQRRLRLESWNHAHQQPVAVAKTILGRPQPYDPIPWAWTDQFDVNLQFLGAGPAADRFLVRGSVEARKAIVFGMKGAAVAGAWLINSGGERRWLLRLMENQQALDDAKLLDHDLPLRSLVSA